MSSIWHEGRIVGEVTSGYFGHRIEKVVGLGMLKSEVNLPGTAVEVEIFGKRYPATVMDDMPLWDPKNERIRA